MGFWEKVKENYREGKTKGEEAAKGAIYTQKYDEEEAKQIAQGMKHKVDPQDLCRKKLGRAPLDRIDDGEQPKYLLKGFDLDIDDNDEGHRSQLLVTDKKIVMISFSITGKTSQYTVSFNDIIGVSLQRRLMPQIRIQTAGHSYKLSTGKSPAELAYEAVEYIRKRKDEIDSGVSQRKQESALEKLDKLSKLQERGAITEDEFNEKKQDLLKRI
jgi:hypothetical protein